MNIHYNPMKCTGCAQEFAFASSMRSYTDLPEAAGRSAVHFSEMLLLPVWCHECEGASWVERIPVAREFDVAAGLRRRPTRSGYDGIDDALLGIEDDDFHWLYQHLRRRKAPPRCLVCASTRFTLIDPSRRQTPIVHEACWDSPIEFCGFEFGSVGLLPFRSAYAHQFHDAEGDFVWAELHAHDFPMGLLTAILHARRQDPDHATLTAAIKLVINRNSEQALAVLAPLAAANSPAALGMLGVLHYVGEGVEHSGVGAIRLLEKAKALGDACAAHNLALLFASGAPCVEQDIARAHQLFDQARAMGGQYERDDFYAQGDLSAEYRAFRAPFC